MNNSITHPKHYEAYGVNLEAIDFCQFLPFCEGNVLKYLFRAGHKDGSTEEADLQKALDYLKRARAFNEKFPDMTDVDKEAMFLLSFITHPILKGIFTPDKAWRYVDWREVERRIKARLEELKTETKCEKTADDLKI